VSGNLFVRGGVAGAQGWTSSAARDCRKISATDCVIRLYALLAQYSEENAVNMYMLVCVQEGQVIECSQVSDIREGVSPKVSAIHGCKNVFLRFQFFFGKWF